MKQQTIESKAIVLMKEYEKTLALMNADAKKMGIHFCAAVYMRSTDNIKDSDAQFWAVSGSMGEFDQRYFDKKLTEHFAPDDD